MIFASGFISVMFCSVGVVFSVCFLCSFWFVLFCSFWFGVGVSVGGF